MKGKTIQVSSENEIGIYIYMLAGAMVQKEVCESDQTIFSSEKCFYSQKII